MALAAVSGSLARAAHAQREFPSRPIRWIVPYPPGAIADIVARTVGTQLAIDTGQPVQIENRAGGNTALGAIEAARAPADGYTVLSTDNGTLVFNPALYRNLSYDPARDFAPVTLLGRLPMVLLVGPSSGVKDARAFIADARAFPGKVSFASAGTGTVQHLAMELLQRQAGLRMVHVPYRGAAPALADLAGGQLPAMMSDLAAANRFIQGGKARALAVANATRLPQLPAVPTFAELGLPRVEAAALLGLAVPAGTPPELVARLQQAMASAIHNPVVLRKLAEFGVEPVGGTPARFEALIGDETARWHPLIKSLNLSLD
ncbi:tripartite-type tricarboxylate transporter receptor subunit TctC [Variovorax boronicumulans]|uniref:Tripartite-type tricarboxylate transporter receptor subunit TctC n=2 Tax=Variovorax boronicumulans TaxID=436515 RepID=A0AAW8CX16_9BURK|nr:tripartite tricarboxylate transporter substrate binding protein [Variovorax boronicumulans]MDP9894787.1 tripartite-type tricarboxylate transporter receptor subunit TctC [Variovorax boronicumulans]MDQ0054606.1 tripartite-type tricarboxylate transporter receptor subunit TctC [Variovorax boronicumulans]